MKRLVIFTFLIVLITATVFAEKLHSEKWYSQRWCAEYGGQYEVTLPDGTRCDCITKTHAVEIDFARNWAEAIGQSLHYARLTNKRAGIVLIITSVNDLSLWSRLNDNIKYYKLPIDIWQYDLN